MDPLKMSGPCFYGMVFLILTLVQTFYVSKKTVKFKIWRQKLKVFFDDPEGRFVI